MPHPLPPKFLKPHQLTPGDRVAAVTLSWGGPGTFPHRYQAGKTQFEKEFKLQVIEMPNALRPPDWVAANPQARADDLMQAFADPTLKAIFTTTGGNDSVRILPYLDLNIIQRNRKIFLGYSDTTITHMACLKAGLGTFYGPSLMAGFAENTGIPPYLANAVRKALFSPDPIGIVPPNPDGWTNQQLDWSNPANQQVQRKRNPSTGWRFLQGAGTATGHLIGGCADILEFLKGTKWWPEPEWWDGAILFLETTEDAPSPRLFRDWLRNYATQGILPRLAALLVGRPGGAALTQTDYQSYDDMLLQVVRDEQGLTSLPLVTQMDFGHTDPMTILPYAISATLDCTRHTFQINNAAVT